MSEAGFEVQVRDLQRSYVKGGRTISVLRGVHLDIQAGERVAILGPSGAGKSTLLHILGGLEPPSGGQVVLAGEDLYGRSSAALDALRNRHIGFVFQFHHLLAEQSALWNVAMPLLIRGEPREAALGEASRCLAQVGLQDRESHRPGELSGGEQQRVAIARALVHGPGLILADEPTGNLDPKTADQVFDLFLRLHQDQGATLVVVTHSRELAARFPRRLTVVEGLLEETA